MAAVLCGTLAITCF